MVRTECNIEGSSYEGLGGRGVESDFGGGCMTSDRGGLLLRKLEQNVELIDRFSSCFIDHRDNRYTDFSVQDSVAQRVYGLCLGYEDVNDHEEPQ